MKVFVFGGTGFIGSRVISNLVGNGHVVYALARSQDKANFIRQLGAAPHLGDLGKRETIREAIKGSDVIVNSAFPSFLGRMSVKRSEREARIGLTLMKNLLETLVNVKRDTPVVLTQGTMGLGDCGTAVTDG